MDDLKHNIKHKSDISKAVFGLFLITLFCKFFGFTEKMVIARFFGTDEKADVYFASMGVILSVVYMVKELIHPSLLPVYSASLLKKNLTSASLFRKVLCLVTVVLLGVVITMGLFSGFIAKICVFGFSEEKMALTSNMIRFLSPACLFLGLSMLICTILNSHKKFYKAALPEAGMKLFIVVGLLGLVPFFGLYALPVVLLIGAGIAFCVQLGFVPETRHLMNFNSAPAKAEFNSVLVLMSPLVIGVVFSHASGLVDNMLASTLPTGHLSYLGYSKKLTDAILLLGPVALMTVVFSQLAHLWASDCLDEFKQLFGKALRIILYVGIPAAIIIVALRGPIVQVIFEGGRFDVESTVGTSRALFVYAVGIVTFSLESLIVYTFYAARNTKIPVIAGVSCVVLDIILAIVFLKPFGYLGIAWAFVISRTIKVICLTVILEKRFRFVCSSLSLIFLGKLAIVTLTSTLVLTAINSKASDGSLINKIVFNLMLPVAGFAGTFVIGSYLLGIKELNELVGMVLRRKKNRNIT